MCPAFGSDQPTSSWHLDAATGPSTPVAVGTCVSWHAPRPDPYVRLSRIRLVWGFPCQGCITPLFFVLLLHSFVRPAPRAFFRPRRHITIAVAHSDGQGRRFFSAA